MLCAKLYYQFVDPRDALISSTAAVRFTTTSARPFDTFKLVYLHCIDLSTKKYVPTIGFPCIEICSVLGHFNFTNELNIRRVCCVLWRSDSEDKLLGVRSPALIRVSSSCGYTVSSRICYRHNLKFACFKDSFQWKMPVIYLCFSRLLRQHLLDVLCAISATYATFVLWLTQQHDGRSVCFIVEFEVVHSSSGITVPPSPKSIQELEENDEEDIYGVWRDTTFQMASLSRGCCLLLLANIYVYQRYALSTSSWL